jgi:alkanesulfonate monooxygenase SsuD/methylene tetrahydromethanopterin reductase-like flavin-dependent oxidoreductase (luciferase family)
MGDLRQVGASWPTHDWIAAGQREIRFGIALMSPLQQTPEAWSGLIALAQRAEDLGFDSFWVPDHPTFYPDCWSTLATLAIATHRLRLGSWVSCVYYRHPIQLARAAADVDRLSAGRLVLGLGIGDVPSEFVHLGLTYAPTPRRQRLLDETVQIVRGLLEGATVTYWGEFFQIEGYALPHGPVQQPYVPLLIAGGGERTTLRQVALYADMANFGEHMAIGHTRTIADVRRKIDVLNRYCADVGRAPATVLRSHTTFPLMLAETPEALAARRPEVEWIRESMVAVTVPEAIAYYNGLIAAGQNYFIASLWDADTETLALLAERVIPALRRP